MSAPQYATVTDDDLITGDAVALDLPAAGIGPRLLSGLIDVLITIVALVAAIIIFATATIRTDPAMIAAAITVATVLVFIVYPTTLETLTRGRSVGKLALGLRTVRDDAGPISFQHALIRSLIGFIEIYLTSGVAAFFSMLLSSRGKRLGDYAAGTYVVRERVKLALPAPPRMPPHLAGWAERADITSLPTGLALAVRQFLGRINNYDLTTRHVVGAKLADRVADHVSPLPPKGTLPEDFLVAVVAARRERDLERLKKQAFTRNRLSRTR